MHNTWVRQLQLQPPPLSLTINDDVMELLACLLPLTSSSQHPSR